MSTTHPPRVVFPSPCGDMVLKYDTIKKIVLDLVEVSVPLRGCGFEIINGEHKEKEVNAMFPSPCGDVVLKFRNELADNTFSYSFRPLAGIWF